MSWRLLARLVFVFAALGICYDAVFNGTGHTAVTATTIGDTLGWLTSKNTPNLQDAWGSTQGTPIWQRLADLVALVPLWFGLCLTAVLMLWSSSDGYRSNTSNSSSLQIGHFSVALLIGIATLVVITDATQLSPLGQQPSSTTVGDVWAQTDLASLSAISADLQAWMGTQFWQITGEPALRMPFWAVFFLAAGLAYAAISRTSHTHKNTAEIKQPSRPRKQEANLSNKNDASGLLAGCGSAFASAGLLSALVNILMLTGALFMLEVYDRVLPSRSVPTLVALGAIVVALFAVQILLDIARNRLLVRIGNLFQRSIAARVFSAQVRLQQAGRLKEKQPEPVQDLDTIRSFLASPGPIVLFDLPWLPIYLAIVFALHPWLGWTAVAGALTLIALTIATDIASRKPTMRASSAAMHRNNLLNEATRNAEMLSVMGMMPRVLQRWDNADGTYLAQQSRISDVTGGFGSTAKGLRLLLQSTVLGVGAFLVIIQEASAGVIIASAILANRTLAPLDQAIGQWRNFVAAQQSWQRLNLLLRESQGTNRYTALPSPQQSLEFKDVSAMAPNGNDLVVKNISFNLKAGQGLGLVGPSGAGKSSIARLIIGAWQPARRQVTLDGSSI